jgi:acetyl/propionyl-CoA carboxylase alpha subunit
MATIKLRPAAGGEVTRVTLERADQKPGTSHFVHIDGKRQPVELELLGTGEGWLRVGGRMQPFFCHREGDRLQLWLAGRVHAVEIVDDAPRRSSAETGAPRSASLTAPMPGAVLKVLATPGKCFKAHQPLVIMESMKMELTLSLPHAGRVTKLACEVGELVEMGAVLVEIDDPRCATAHA